MKSSLLHNVSCYLRIVLVAAIVALTLNIKGSYAANIAQVRAFAGFIAHIYQNTDTANNGNGFCVFGSDDISLQILTMLDKRVVKELGERIDRKRNYNECRVIYIAKNKEKDAKHSVQFFNEKGALTIATFRGFVADGGMMSVQIGRRNFELTVDELAIKKSGVKIDSSVASLIVD